MDCDWYRQISVCRTWEIRFDFYVREKVMDWDFHNTEETRWRKKEITGKRYWRSIFLKWKLLFIMKKIKYKCN